MITYINGNIFESPAKVLVNTVNTDGAMGKGLAKDFKIIYPQMFKEYQNYCEKGLLTIGKLFLFKTPQKWILNFPTKTTWREPSKIEYIEEGLIKFVNSYNEKKITSIAFPALGCGNGGLDWEKQVKPLMEKYLGKISIDVFIYLKSSSNLPEHKNIKEISSWLRSNTNSLSFSEVKKDLRELIDGINSFVTFNNEEFKVNSIKDDGIEFFINSNDIFIDDEKLIEFWDQIRSYGFTSKNIIPRGLEEYSDYLIALFSHMSYCKVVKISEDDKLLNSSNKYGLQWVPPVVEENLFNVNQRVNLK